MPAMTTGLTGFSVNGNTITYETSGSTFSRVKHVVQRRGNVGSNTTVAKGSVSVVHGMVDSDGELLSPSLRLVAESAVPIGSVDADIDAAIVIFRDYVASDEFVAAVKSGTKLADF